MGRSIKVIGAGIFGCCIAAELVRGGHRVVLIEEADDIMQKASKLNHNRIHFGFHYPRSPATARQSLEGLITFFLKFKEAIVSDFPNYYMIAKEDSLISPEEYAYFCDKVEISYSSEFPPEVLINRDSVSSSFKVLEPIFDYDVLYSLVKDQLKGVELRLNTRFDGNTTGYDYIINSSYSQINIVSQQLGIPELALKFQDVIVPIFKMVQPKIGLTVMDGPFSSIMPKGNNKNQFLLYHPRRSVVAESYGNNFLPTDSRQSIQKIYKDSQRFYPFLKDVKPIGHWRTVRALPVNDNDARLSEIFINSKHPRYINVLSGKVSTCLKVALEVKNIVDTQSHKSLIV